MKLTRDELGDLIQDRLSGFIYAFDEMLARHHRSWADLSAVVTVGGGASIPLVTRTSFGAQPQAGRDPVAAGMRGRRRRLAAGVPWRTRRISGRARPSACSARPTRAGDVVDLGAGDVLVIDHEALTDRELAWSQTEYPGDIRVPYTPAAYDEDGAAGWSMRLNMIEPPPERTRAAPPAVAVDHRDVRPGRDDRDRRRGLHVVRHRKPSGPAGAHRRAGAGTAGESPGAKSGRRRLRRPRRRRRVPSRCPAPRRHRRHRRRHRPRRPHRHG